MEEYSDFQNKLSLYSQFDLELKRSFRDYGYSDTRAKELSCEWILSKIPKGSGVDVGGTSYLVRRIQDLDDRKITYFDIFPPKDLLIKKYIQADMNEFGIHIFPKTLEFITTRHTLEHSLNPLFQLWQFNRALKDNGLLIVVLPSHSKKWVWFYTHFNCLPLENWLMLFYRSGFKVIETSAGSWAPHDPDFIEYRFVLQVVVRGIRLDN